jgi:hypothetical protein
MEKKRRNDASLQVTKKQILVPHEISKHLHTIQDTGRNYPKDEQKYLPKSLSVTPPDSERIRTSRRESDITR